ncbi:hypothetical protein SAPIG1231 [Staphylococcus aureus subsp. aureus ST398]|nr:hypothetical protein M140OLGA_0066 [Staphylococcus aureus subsp. aureus 112808A]CAQ49655.1 hypothetical protein SAPIG1231 [Staphylococcus aureus subsp. aureus ST398]
MSFSSGVPLISYQFIDYYVFILSFSSGVPLISYQFID